MGIFITHKKSNHDTIESVSIEYHPDSVNDESRETAADCPNQQKRGVNVSFKLKEYDLYERLLVFRGTTRREGVSVIATVEGSYDPFAGTNIEEIARERYAWDKEKGPHGGLEYQIQHAWIEVKAEIDEYLDRGVELAEAVDEVVDNE